jgi:hypothetical protein
MVIVSVCSGDEVSGLRLMTADQRIQRSGLVSLA